MTISYSSGTITLTNETADFQDIVDAGVSGIEKPQADTFVVTANIKLVNSTLSDTNKSISFIWGSVSSPLLVDEDSTLQFGELSGGYGINGCQIFMRHTNTGTANLGSTSGNDSGNLKIYGSAIQGISVNDGNFFWRFYDDRTGQVVDLVDNVWNNFYGGGRFQGATSRILRQTYLNCNATSSPFTTKSPFGEISDVRVLKGSNSYYWFTGLTGTHSVYNLYSRGCDNLLYATDPNNYDPYICYFVDPDVDVFSFDWVGAYIGSHRVYEQYNYVPTIVNKNTQAAITSGRVAIYDNAGTEVFNEALDGNGQVGEALLTAGTYQSSNGNTRTDKTPHTIKQRSYGFVFQEFPVTMASRTVVTLGATVNSYTVANETTASGYSTKFTLDWTNRIITVNASANPQEMYDYTQYAAAQSANMQYDELMATSDGKTFTLNNARLVIAAGGSLTINPEEATLVFPDGSPTPCITNNGTLQLGVKTGDSYTSGVAIRCEEPGDTARGAFDARLGGVLVSTANGSSFIGYGATIETATVCSIMGEGAYAGFTGTCLIEDLTFKSLRSSPLSGSPQLRFDNVSGQSVSVSGLTVSAAGGAEYGTVLFATDYTSFSFSAVSGVVQHYTAQPSDLILNGLEFDGNQADYDFVTNGNIIDPDDVFTLRNVDIGSAVRVGNVTPVNNYRGAVALETTLTLRTLEPDGTPIEGAKSYLPTYDDGNQAEPVGRTGFGWTSEPAYTFTSDANGEDAQDVLVATCVNTENATGLLGWSYRCLSGDDTDDFAFLTPAYGFQPSTVTTILKGASGATAEARLLPDLGITEADKAVVAAYTGISANYSGGTLTVTATADHTWNEVYDFIKYWESQNPDAVWANSKTSFVSTSNKLSYTYNNLVIVVNGATLTMGAGQSLPTAPTVSNDGKFISASLVLFYDGADLVKASQAYFQVKDSVTAGNIEGAVIGFGDAVEEEKLLYNSSFVQDTLVTDVDGKANGYFAFEKGATVYTDLKQTTGEYDHVFSTIPRTLTGASIGSSGSPEVVRLAPDSEVTLTKANAALVTGITVDATTDTIDLSDETLSVAYDNLKYQVTADADIDTGIPGCMYYCLYGLPLSKISSTYTGRSSSTIYQNVNGAGATFGTGVIELDTAGTYADFTFNAVQLNFEGAGTYDLRSSTFNSTITLDTIGDYTVTAQLPTGTIYTNNDPTNITVELNATIAITNSNLVDGTRVQVMNKTHDNGTAESGTSSTLTDTDKSWTIDEYVDETLFITGGTGSGQERKIASNTATVITISGLFKTTPDATSTYSIGKELRNTAVSGGSGYTDTFTVGSGEEIEDGDTIMLRSAYNSGTTYYNETEEIFSASATDQVLLDTQSSNTILDGYALDGSSQSDFTADYPNVEIDINSGDTTRPKLLCWLAYIITTEDGIRFFFGGITHEDSGNARINTETVNLHLDYTGVGSSRFTDQIRLYRDDNTTLWEGTGDNFYADSGKVYQVETGVSGLTTAESEELSKASNALTLPQFIALK